ncbi:YueH family protein [Bacillus sp. REN10]|uniref:YueH family protein n=1 Tax=Bacillus sp. REN10 TaxID=2782541 RepID=UPI00193B2005|nr:YueH family protein [Bacillus sp. REN10]
MKIRKTLLHEKEIKVYIYENKKEETFVVAVPTQEWSISFTYEENGEHFVNKLFSSLMNTGLDQESAEGLAHRIYQWTCEM